MGNDGYGDVIIGAPRYDGEYTDTGSVFVYQGSAQGLGEAPAPSLTEREIDYVYDPLGRLVEASYTSTGLSAGSTGEHYEYAYDAVGNRAAMTVTLGVTGTPHVSGYTYDAANRLVLSQVEGLTSVDGVQYHWDMNGNRVVSEQRISDSVKTFSYDRANRLVGVTGAGLSWSAVYNGDGARVQQTANSSVTTYILDPSALPLGCARGKLRASLAAPLVTVLAEQQATNDKTYVYAAGTRPLAEYDTGGWMHYLPDGLGSLVLSVVEGVRQEVDSSGDVSAVRSFDPYGNVLDGDASAPLRNGVPFGYTGEQYDAYINLLFLRARYLQPTLGVFLSRDPWSGDPLRPGSMNGWIYAEGDPIRYADLTGYYRCGGVDCLTTPGESSQWIWVRGYARSRLDLFAQNQLPDYPMSCAPFAMAMSINVLTGRYRWRGYVAAHGMDGLQVPQDYNPPDWQVH